ncbi:uncharacterized protein LOC144660988, partial [Oculina patagonica]
PSYATFDHLGSPVSPVVANLCMEEIKETAINSTPVPPKIWKRYVDDSFCVIKKNAVASFHDSLNSIDPHISFTIKHESNGQLSFLDTLISRDNNKLNIDVYRKPTHTDRYLDFRSHHDREHKISTAATLLHRALKLPNSESRKAREIDRISIALQSNGYPPKVTADIIRKKSSNPPTPSPEELVGMFFSWADPMNSQSFAVLPYIKGITEPLTRILKSHDIRDPSNQQTNQDTTIRVPCPQVSTSGRRPVQCCLQNPLCVLSLELHRRDKKIV